MYAGFSLIPRHNTVLTFVSLFLIALDIVTIMVNTSNARVINATTGELTVEWVEPGNDCGCNCTSTYIVRTNGNDIGTTDCAEGETTVQLQICEEHSLTIVPVLNHGITVESSSSNVAPVLIGKIKFPAHRYCSLLQCFWLFYCKEKFEAWKFKQL